MKFKEKIAHWALGRSPKVNDLWGMGCGVGRADQLNILLLEGGLNHFFLIFDFVLRLLQPKNKKMKLWWTVISFSWNVTWHCYALRTLLPKVAIIKSKLLIVPGERQKSKKRTVSKWFEGAHKAQCAAVRYQVFLAICRYTSRKCFVHSTLLVVLWSSWEFSVISISWESLYTCP